MRSYRRVDERYPDDRRSRRTIEEVRSNNGDNQYVDTYDSRWGQRIVWDILAIVEILLFLRFLFLLFGAGLAPFTRFLYSVTQVFVAPFRGLFSAPTFGSSQFSVETIVAMIVWALIAWAIVAIIDAVLNRAATRCVGPNCYPVR